MSDINWNVELRKLDREFRGLPKEPSQAEVNARRASERLAQLRQDAINANIGATARLVLVSALAVALYFWPYARSCGTGLFLYMGSEALVAAGALWILVYTWRHRLVRTHALAIAMLFGSLALLAAQVLPRIGYISALTQQTQWWCR